jgi:hypothetical protein
MRSGAGRQFGLQSLSRRPGSRSCCRALRLADAPSLLAGGITYAAAAFVALALVIALFGRELLHGLDLHAAGLLDGSARHPVVVLAYLPPRRASCSCRSGSGIEKRARYYPLITAAAAGTNIVLDLRADPRDSG